MSKHYITAALTASLLTACGGGGGGSDTKETIPPESILTGSFVDSPVEGLRYETPTQKGLTNNLGEFKYVAGESVTFFLGGTQLGVTLGASLVTPFSLFGITPLTSEHEIIEALSGNDTNSFDRALNVATLLQTFDIDANPENGINLGSSHSDLNSITIPLLVKARTFENQTELNNAKTLANVSQSRTFGDATQHLYNSLDIEIESSLTSTFTSIQNNKPLGTVSFEYNADGKIISESTDTDNNGTSDITKTFTYDSIGDLVQTSNSATNTTETLSYDGNHNLLTRLINRASGNDTQENYDYVDNKLERFELDQNADGSIDTITRYTYNAQGKISSYDIDRDGDGTIDSLSTYSYLNNNLSSYSEDSDNDGIPNIVIAYSYDNNGNRTSQNINLSAIGAPNTIATFEYDTQNNATLYEQDRNMDGTTDYTEAYAYNKNNKRTLVKRDLDADGTWDVVAQYSYDINGNRTKMIEDSDGNGIVDKIWTGNYEAAVLENTWEIILGKL